MGVVYEAEQLTLGRTVALKMLPFAGVLDKRALSRFQNEARAAATLEHPNIVPVYAVGEDRGVHYYAMRLIRGQSLAEAIATLRGSVVSRQLSVAEASVVSSQLSVARNSPPTDHGPLTTDQPATDGGPLTTDNSEIDTQPVAALSTDYSTNPKHYFRRVAEIGIQIAEALHHAHEHGILIGT